MTKDSSKPPLCKGRWQKSLIFDGGVVLRGVVLRGIDFRRCKVRALRPLRRSAPAPLTQGSLWE